MRKLRVVLATALLVFVWLLVQTDAWIPSEPSDWWWLKAPAYTFFGLGAICASLFLIITATAGNTENLWKTWWFHYMRMLWGHHFGGYNSNEDSQYVVVPGLVVDNCKAFWLSLFTLSFWLFSIGIWGVILLILSVATTANLTSIGKGATAETAFILAVALSAIALVTSATLLPRITILHRAQDKMMAAFGGMLLAQSFIFGVVQPLHYFSPSEYVLGLMYILVLMFGIIAAACLVILLGWRVWRAFRLQHITALGSLVGDSSPP